MSALIGADVLARTLRELGAECVFGLPGTQNVATFGAFRRARVHTVLCMHELGACFMANGYARASGNVGVVVTIPGPGFTFALPGLAEARLDSAPVLHVVGQPPEGSTGRFDHQSIPQEAMVRPLVKDVIAVNDARGMREAVKLAWSTALDGEPGPVVLHVSRSAQIDSVDGAPSEESQRGVSAPPVRSDDLIRAGERLASARRPVLFLGQGAAGARDDVVALAETLGSPVLSTPSGRGIVPETHRLCMCFDPDRGAVDETNALLREADLIVALGCRMGFNGTAGMRLSLPKERLLHVNTDWDALRDSPFPAGVPVQGRVEDVVPHLLKIARGTGGPLWSLDEVASRREEIREGSRSSAVEPVFEGVPGGSAAALFGAFRRALTGDAIVVTDSGLHQVLTRRHFEVTAPRSLLLPCDFQSMGFGVPAAMGAALAVPDRHVVAIVGDGGFAMAAMELLTAVREKLNVVVVVFNDGYLNLIRLQQIGDDGVPFAVSLPGVDYAGLCDSLGVGYALVEGDPEETLKRALVESGPVLVEVRVRDSAAIGRRRVTARAKSVARGVLGPTLVGRLKQFIGRGR